MLKQVQHDFAKKAGLYNQGHPEFNLGFSMKDNEVKILKHPPDWTNKEFSMKLQRSLDL